MNDPYLTHNDVVNLLFWVDAAADLAAGFGREPSENYDRMRAALADVAETRDKVYLVSDGRPC